MSERARRFFALCAFLGALLVCAPQAAVATSVGYRVIGGGPASLADHPWQVAIARDNVADAFQAQFCGGAIIDALHVLTAAHCLDFGGDNLPDPPDSRDVIAGLADLSAPLAAPAQRIEIAGWDAMPGYDFMSSGVSPNDVALVTLSEPINTAAPGGARAAVLPAPGARTAPGSAVRVSGWGVTESLPGGSPQLRAAGLLSVSDAQCGAYYPLDLDPDTMLCAIAPGRDSCNGDSGGPLTEIDGRLIGIVSWGPVNCADPSGAPGVYTELADPEVATFIRDLDATTGGLEYAPPQPTAPLPTLVGLPKSGDTMTCVPGAWTSVAPGEPERHYRFQSVEGVVLREWSTSPAFTPADSDAGRRIVCTERARDASGASVASSAASEPVVGPPPPPPPVASPPPAPAPTPAPAPKPVDTVAPRISFVYVRCSKRSCHVRVRVVDRGATVSGVKEVRVTALPHRGRSRVVTARPLGRGLYEARFKRLARGSAWFTLTARDRAGNRPARVALRRARVR